MSLERSKLQMVRELGNGGWQARCPACAESGQDRKGEHLRISPDGKFGCCVFPGDHEHRKRIFALAGAHGPKAIKIKVAESVAAFPVQQDLLGRLGRAFWNAEGRIENEESKAEEIGTVGTCVSDPRAYADKTVEGDLYIGELIESRESVPGVPALTPALSHPMGEGALLPFLKEDGTVVIPFSSPERYHWWKGGQTVRQTVTELLERKELDASPF